MPDVHVVVPVLPETWTVFCAMAPMERLSMTSREKTVLMVCLVNVDWKNPPQKWVPVLAKPLTRFY